MQASRRASPAEGPPARRLGIPLHTRRLSKLQPSKRAPRDERQNNAKTTRTGKLSVTWIRARVPCFLATAAHENDGDAE